MKRLFTTWTLTLCVLSVLSSGYAQAQSVDAGTLFGRMKAKYESLNGLRAEFSQTMTSDFSDEAVSSAGVLYLRKNQFRVETASQVLVNDGKVTWVYLPTEKQVLINDYVEEESLFNINDFFFDYNNKYNVTQAVAETVGGQRHFRLTLKPKNTNGLFEEVTLWLRDRDDVVTRLQVRDVNGTQMRFELKNVQLNPTLDARTFHFDPPAGTEIIDMRS